MLQMGATEIDRYADRERESERGGEVRSWIAA
jgi:hypothetical protein